MKAIAEQDATDFDAASLVSKQPRVIRGLVKTWPAVNRGRESAAALVEYLRRFDCGKPVDALMTPPDADGKIFYDAAMQGFNFVRNRLPLSTVAEQVLRYAQFPKSPAVAAQSASVAECLPGFAAENCLPMLSREIQPRIWLGNRITTPTHLDEWNNIGCVVAGRRRFTLFSPEQVENLYVGPLDFAPTGAPMSMVALHRPDFARYPRFTAALAAAQHTELDPGDAIFIPPLWWHHVESLEPFNVLVNYWWHERTPDPAQAESGFDSLLHALLSIRDLPAETRQSWKALFDAYVFGARTHDLDHIPKHRRGVLGELSSAQRITLKEHLRKRLT